MRVIVTRPPSEAGRWALDLARQGFEVVALPLIDILPPPRPQELAAAWQGLEGRRAVMFVSGNAVRHFFAQRPAGAGWPATTRAWATGAGTRQALLDCGLKESQVDAPAAQAAQFDSETLWQQVSGQVREGDRVLIVRGQDQATAGIGRPWLAGQLDAAGVGVDTVLAYVRAAPAFTDLQRRQACEAAHGGWVWLFGSSQAIANLQGWLPEQSWSQARAVATHARIAQTARQAGFGVVCESLPSLAAVTAALESFR